MHISRLLLLDFLGKGCDILLDPNGTNRVDLSSEQTFELGQN